MRCNHVSFPLGIARKRGAVKKPTKKEKKRKENYGEKEDKGVGQCMIAGAALSLLDITVELVSGSLAFSRFVVGTRMQAQEREGGAVICR